MKRIFQIIIIVLILGICAYFFVMKDERLPHTSVSVGNMSPDFELQTQDGRLFKLSGLRGKVVVLNFWATWCHACQEEIPSMNELAAAFASNQLEIVAVSLDNSWDEIDALFKKMGKPKFLVLLDQEKTVFQQYGVHRVPESFIISPDGTIIKHIMGTIDWNSDKTKSLIRILLNKS
ncbi:MAG: TlpA family protein disulfide reductase [Deltaproteobacteria bacterium]|nr:TlpA family protein disulfide reductase [Deltaproteobacteria bacterium]